MENYTKRKLKEVVRGLIGDGFSGTQSELVKLLKQRGFNVTQSTISRMMSEMGIIKETSKGHSIYKLKLESQNHYQGTLSDLIVCITHNSVNIVIKTKAGSAMFIAGFIDHECKEIILGTVAGDDTIIIIPTDIKKIIRTTEYIKSIL